MRAFGADLRSLAAFRVVLGVIVLLDLVGRSSDARVLYSDEGILTRSDAQAYISDDRWSFMFANGSLLFTQLFFLATALTAVAVILGYRTRLAVVLLWVLVISIQSRNPYHLFGADTLTRALLFWGMFLPLGEVWSLDSRGRDAADPRSTDVRFISVGSVALFLQIAFMYWFTMLLKTGDAWRSDFTALWWTYNASHLTSPFGQWLLQFPGLLKVLTVLTLIVEACAPFLLFLPFRNGAFRMAGVVMLMGLHLGILLTLTIGIFPVVSGLCMVCFLPSAFWDSWLPRVAAGFRNATGVSRRVPQWAARGSAAVVGSFRGLAGANPARLSFAFFQGESPTARPHERVAGRAPGTGEKAPDRPGPRSTPRRRAPSSLPGNLAAACFLLLVFGYNLGTVSAYQLPAETRPLITSLGLYQNWSMFAPAPPTDTRWHVLAGTTERGEAINLLRALTHDDYTIVDPFTLDVPPDITSGYYGDIRWRRYLGALDQGSKDIQRARMASYVCRSWNDLHPDNHLVTLTFIYISLPTAAGGDLSPRIASQHTC
jgi:hypothetical protein